MQRAMIVAILLATFSLAAGNVLNIPSNQKVTIEGTEVYSQSAGFGSLNQCSTFAPMFVQDSSKPTVTVCGGMTKVTVFLRNSCEGYHTYSVDIGSCDSSAASTACQSQSPATLSWMAHAQSYKITQC